jgi:hypothetical protein
MAVKLLSKLPANDGANGLAAIYDKLVTGDRDTTHVVIAYINRKRVTTEDDDGQVIPTARIIHCEVLTGADAETGSSLLRKAHKLRTGAETLPFEDGDPAGED